MAFQYPQAHQTTPRVRGIRGFHRTIHTPGRITPACAGNTYNPSHQAGLPWDHPRVCGEYEFQLPALYSPEGLPPRVRGILLFRLFKGRQLGITPACAGNTIAGASTKRKGRDHPRVCGEYTCCVHLDCSAEGSPPRVRGIRLVNPAKIDQHRITPACAGNTPHLIGTFGSSWDHPRVCGEYNHYSLHMIHYSGSPPRVRGIPGQSPERNV